MERQRGHIREKRSGRKVVPIHKRILGTVHFLIQSGRRAIMFKKL